MLAYIEENKINNNILNDEIKKIASKQQIIYDEQTSLRNLLNDFNNKSTNKIVDYENNQKDILDATNDIVFTFTQLVEKIAIDQLKIKDMLINNETEKQEKLENLILMSVDMVTQINSTLQLQNKLKKQENVNENIKTKEKKHLWQKLKELRENN